MGACINFYAQLYFLYRLSAISMRSWVVWPLAMVVVFSWLSVVVAVRVVTKTLSTWSDLSPSADRVH